MNLRPLRGQCLVEILPDTATGPIIIPETAEQRDNMGKLPPLRAFVRRLGPWPQKKGGRCVLPEFTPGDTVIVSQYAGQKLKSLGDKFRLVKVDDVLAVVK